MNLNDRIKKFWEGEAELYCSSIEDELKGFQRDAWKKVILEHAPRKDRLEILDVGTGPGFFPILLGEEGHSVTGIDLSENMIRFARENAGREGIQAKFVTMDCQKLLFPEHTFDLVVCRNITWTLDDPEAAYREWYRVLRPGGRVLIFDACWYLHLFDEEIGKRYRENEKRIQEKYGRGAHGHNDPEEEQLLGRKLFLSDKYRPQWDLDILIRIGFAQVFSTLDITGRVWDELGKELNAVSPQFLVGGEK